MRAIRFLVALATALCAGVAAAQTVVTSDAPARVAVTIYRAPEREAATPIDRDWLQGYALISETRTIAVPKGRATIRFEGVAAGILPESAIVTGLPAGVREKNLDADLLSPRSLYARSFGRPVTIRHQIGKRTVEERAIIRSGPDGAAILQTKDGFVAASCTGQDSLVYQGVPPALPARPTLSIETDSPVAGTATVTLSYLAWGFDWQANYVATMRPDGRSADLFAWVTLASSDSTSFADAETAVVAGNLARSDSAPDRGGNDDSGALIFHCTAHPYQSYAPPAAAPVMEMDGDIVVTAMRRDALQSVALKAVEVKEEELGDLKLYRVPHPTTVAAMAQKQVGLLSRPAVPVGIVYRLRIDGDDAPERPTILLRALNRADRGLGLPLPAGPVAVFEPHDGHRLPIGLGFVADKAVGEEVEIAVADATQVTTELKNDDDDPSGQTELLTVRNANPFPVRFEAEIELDDGDRLQSRATFTRKNGRSLWAIAVPANGTRVLRYKVVPLN